MGRPEVIFADEPTGNLDSHAGAEVLSFLRQSVREHGQTIIMVTHDPVAASYTDRVVFLADGAIAGELHDPTPDKVLATMQPTPEKTQPTPEKTRPTPEKVPGVLV
jgi:putative ABC transport system ATP-binding protein